LAGRELRGGLRGFGIFIACLTLGVAAIAAVGSVSSSVVAGLRADARELLGGDVELRLMHRPATAAELRYLERHGKISMVAEMRAMAIRPDRQRRSLIELKAVDDAYPLYGATTLDSPRPLDRLLAKQGGAWGAVVDPALLQRLGLALGDTVRIGDTAFVLRGRLLREPDAVRSAFVLGPRVMIASEALAATGLVQPGALVGYAYRVRLPPGSDAHRWAEAVKGRFPDAGWRVREFTDAAPSVQRFLDRVTLFLTLVGLTALLVGGVGVGNAVRGYLGARTATIATLKCLGAPAGLVFRVYLAQVLAIAAVGILLGLAIGAAAPAFFAWSLADRLPVAAKIAIYPAPLALAAVFGVLVTLVFSLWPLGRAREIPAASLFRDLVAPAVRVPRPACLAGIAACTLALAALAIVSAEDSTIAAWFVVGAATAFAAFRLAAFVIMMAARHAGRPRQPGLRLALANLYRPGAPTASVVMSLGLGLTVLVAIALIEGNLLTEVRERLPENAPSYFFLDIQPDQVATFDHLVATTPGVLGSERVPSLRGRITRLDGVPVEKARVAPEAQWAIRSERGLTYAATLPRGSRVVEGAWWPADYHGPPLVSFDEELAHGMGLKVGDTITVNVLGREVTARIANLRRIEWLSLGINFTLVFAPGILEGAPHTFLATVRAAPIREEQLERVVTDALPNVSAIRVRDALAAVGRIFESIAEAVRLTAGVTLLAGTLVLAGAIAAGHRRRVYDAVVLKVLGATRRDITRAFLLEYGLLGAITAMVSAILGTLAAWLVLTRVMHADWLFLPTSVLATAALATLLTIVLGFVGTWRALGAKAAPLLRNE
jgi:putative ABC transport system permease protein